MKKIYFIILFSFNLQAELIKAPAFDSIKMHGGVTDFTPHGTQPGLKFSLEPSQGCSTCHGGASASPTDIDYMPFASWSGSMMANATRDPLFWAALDVANQDIPGVGDFCIRCHSPMGFYKGHTKDGTGNMDFANGCELSGTVTEGEGKLNDYQGINCHFCHRQEQTSPMGDPQILENSNIWLDDEDCDNPDSSSFGPCRKGPYNDYASNPNVGNPPHAWEHSNFVGKSEFCGSCHNVTSPEVLTNGVLSYARTLIDSTGVDTGIAMPIERTFDEWKNSMFSDLIFKDSYSTDEINEIPNLIKGQSCQDCHMPETDSLDARACVFNPLGARAGNLKKHEFAGGNSWMPLIIKNLYGVALSNDNFDRSLAFDRTIISAMDMLQSKSATIETEIQSQSTSQLNVNVKVTNLTGHKLPTGYFEGRRMWIHLIAKDANESTIYESGAYDIKTAELTEIGTKIYEASQGIWNGKSCITSEEISDGKNVEIRKLFHFVTNDCIAKDNRIPPFGFTGGSNIEIKPVGITFPERPGHPGQTVNYDVTPYSITIPNGTPLPITVTATLKFQVASKDYIEFLETESTTATENVLCNRTQTDGPANQSRGDFMKSLWDLYGKSAPVDMVNSSIQTTE